MKLRNKKTGEVVDEISKVGLVWNRFGTPDGIRMYNSLAELNEEWEDYKPIEPLIKDEMIRKAVRAWSEANQIDNVTYDISWNAFGCRDFTIAFDYDFDRRDGLRDGAVYTITELCGVEEE